MYYHNNKSLAFKRDYTIFPLFMLALMLQKCGLIFTNIVLLQNLKSPLNFNCTNKPTERLTDFDKLKLV